MGGQMVAFDNAHLSFPLIIRKWKKGDIIKPFGMLGSKKLSDLFIDHKISLVEKENVFVIESKGEIILVPGIRQSSIASVRPETTKAFFIHLEKMNQPIHE